VLVAASPGPRRHGAACRGEGRGSRCWELAQQFGRGYGDQVDGADAAVRSVLQGSGHDEGRADEEADRGPAAPGPTWPLPNPLTCLAAGSTLHLVTEALISFTSGAGSGPSAGRR
jgi:hypothetical protein